MGLLDLVLAIPSPVTDSTATEAEYEKNEFDEITFWRNDARSHFTACRDADHVRDEFRAVWRSLEEQGEPVLDAVLEEFTTALQRFGQGR